MDYNEALHPLLGRWIARAGMNDNEIASELGIPVTMFEDWKDAHKEFAEAVTQGRAHWNSLAEQSLEKLLKGYNADETIIDVGKDGQAAKVRKVTRHIPPNPAAVIFQLKNRRTFEIASQVAQHQCPAFDCPFNPVISLDMTPAMPYNPKS